MDNQKKINTKRNYLIGAGILILFIAIKGIPQTEWYERTFHPKRYWEQRVNELDHLVRGLEARMLEYMMVLKNKPDTMPADIQGLYADLINEGMKPDEAWEKAVQINLTSLKTYPTLISLCSEQLEKTRKELKRAKVELAKCQ